MSGYDVERLTPGGVTVRHHDGPIQTEGPWLLLHAGDAGDLGDVVAAYPAHAVVGVTRCEGRCDGGGGG